MPCILPPKDRQVRDYVAMRISHLSGTQMHVQGRVMGIQPLPNMPSLDKGLSEAQAFMLHVELSRDVWDLNENQLQEVLEALQTKMA